jgi:hypothetical protein
MMEGYGRGWSEPLAKGRWARMRQRMREPATTRYLAEFDRRWNTRNDRDGDRTVRVIETAIGRRVTYAEIIS